VKKVLLISFLIVFVVSLCAELFPVKMDKFTPDFSASAPAHKTISRYVPEWEWSITPQDLLTNYADYFQCYNQTPVALQPEDHGGGIYIMYRVKDQAENSEISYSYIDNMGVVQASQSIGSVGYYPDAVVDQQTGDVFGSWHVDNDDETYDCIAIYDLYNLIQGNGLWKDPVITILDSDAQDDLDPTFNDEFLWPQLVIGPSPVVGKQRIYCVAGNANESDSTEALPSENVMIMYADFDETDLMNQSNLEWSYNTVPMFDSWNEEDPYWYRPIKSFCVIDNQLIFMGYRLAGAENPEPQSKMFCFINDNYGEGDNWQENYQDWEFEEDNPTWEDAETGMLNYLYSESDSTSSVPYDRVFQTFIHTAHFNLVPTHNQTKVAWPGAMGISMDVDSTQTNVYIPLWYQIYPKLSYFDLNTHEFSFSDVYPTGANPSDNIPMKPWDLDEDGEYDDLYDDNAPRWAQDWPIFHFDDGESAFHYNEYYVTTNEENGWMAYLWVDGMMAKEANEGTEGYEDWVAKPEIAVCVSNNWGATWSDPIFMNANPNSDDYVVELDGMIPCFAYPGDRIEDDGNDYGIVHLFFLDDNDYGSFHSQQQGLNNGSTFEYAAMRIYFGEPPIENDETELVSVPLEIMNYPNPFNPVTTIQFKNETAGNVRIDVYNVKGQKITTLTNQIYEAGINTVTWNGTDDNGSEIPSGVYFYKTKFGKYTTSKKMILMK